MNEITIHIVSVVAILGFLWGLHHEIASLRKEFGRDIADLRERMARVEGLLEGFVSRPRESKA